MSTALTATALLAPSKFLIFSTEKILGVVIVLRAVLVNLTALPSN